MQAEEKTRTRAFRVPVSLDEKLVEKAAREGFMRPSDYIRELVRRDIMREA